MQTRGVVTTYTFAERRPKPGGPWDDEPDKAQWVDEATDLDCLVVRNHSGALCGYVGVPPGHRWHGVDYANLAEEVDVHGELTFSDLCQEGAEDGPGVCHVPLPGRPAAVWWLGFDCAHVWDLVPGHREFGVGERGTYRTYDYVRTECARLALQVAAAAS